MRVIGTSFEVWVVVWLWIYSECKAGRNFDGLAIDFKVFYLEQLEFSSVYAVGGTSQENGFRSVKLEIPNVDSAFGYEQSGKVRKWG